MKNNFLGIFFLFHFISAYAGSDLSSQPSFLTAIGFPIAMGALFAGGELVRRGTMPERYGHGTKPGWVVVGLSAVGVVISGLFYYGARFGLI